MSFSSLISAFPVCWISSSDHHYVVSTHPQSNTVVPLVHSRASPSCLCSSIRRALLYTATVSPSFFTSELSSIAEHLRLVPFSPSPESCLTVRIKVEKSNNGVSTKGLAFKNF
ncbi:hypothetical protein F2Q68_00025711 [Brassica cretica]|uniref:Uncharacterized protein n=1 Tax=Brassica cretica TaxID=69181 RepID=A0A8S9I9X1_BRACR|nr:hypothetical protein F2Q68_00025711 [Brassica cretica]